MAHPLVQDSTPGAPPGNILPASTCTDRCQWLSARDRRRLSADDLDQTGSGRVETCLVVFCLHWQAVAVSTDETPLAIWGNGAAASKARRRRDVVLHTAGPWSRSVIALLKHLEAVGFEGAPRPVGDGFDADGREAITYIPGTTPHPRAWDDHAIGALGTLVRRLHDATASFQPPADASWQPSFARL